MIDLISRMRKLALSGLAQLTALFALGQPGPFNGRWIFQALMDSETKVPLFILQITTTGRTPTANLLSSSAEVSIKKLDLGPNSITLTLNSGEQPVIFQGVLKNQIIRGTITGPRLFDRPFSAKPTKLQSIHKRKPQERENLEGYRKAMQIQNMEKRILALETFIHNHPESRFRGTAQFQIFTALLSLGAEDQKIREAADKTVETASNRSRALNNIARSLAREKRLLDLAETCAQESIKGTTPGSATEASFVDTLGQVLFEQGDLAKAGQFFKQALDIAPGNGTILFHLGQVLEAQERHSEATEYYLKAYVNNGRQEIQQKLETIYQSIHGSLGGLHERIDREYTKKRPVFEVGQYQGIWSGKVVLAELFTGSECHPCQAANYAFQRLAEHYPHGAVQVLEYHLPIPRSDPMTNPDSLARTRYYFVQSTPQAFFGGLDRGLSIMLDKPD